MRIYLPNIIESVNRRFTNSKMDNYKENRGDEYQKMGFVMFTFIFLATYLYVYYFV